MERTLCLALSSFESGALINTLRTLEGALKWRFRCFLREEDTLLFNFIAADSHAPRETRGKRANLLENPEVSCDAK